MAEGLGHTFRRTDLFFEQEITEGTERIRKARISSRGAGDAEEGPGNLSADFADEGGDWTRLGETICWQSANICVICGQ